MSTRWRFWSAPDSTPRAVPKKYICKGSSRWRKLMRSNCETLLEQTERLCCLARRRRFANPESCGNRAAKAAFQRRHDSPGRLMMKRTVAAALAASALLTMPPLAAQTGKFITQEKSDQWRASKLIGVNVYNQNNDKIGDIREVIVDK